MKVLIHFSAAMIGGHVISATTEAAALARRQHDIRIACDDGPLLRLFDRYRLSRSRIPFPLGKLEGNYFYNRHTRKSVHALIALVQEYQPDIINSFDVPATVQAALSSLTTRIPVVQTICGGMVPEFSPPPTDGIIVFSKELADGLTSRYPWTRDVLAVIPHRMDLLKDPPPVSIEDLAQLGWDMDTQGILMTTRLNVNKEAAVRHVMAALLTVAEHFPRVKAAIVGGGRCFETLNVEAQRTNAKAGREIVRLTGSIPEADRFARYAAVVLGVGRAAFEGMRYAKPTVIVGESGFAGEVAPEHIEALSYYNFSGRNARTPSTPASLAEVIMGILGDEARASLLGRYGRGYLESSLDVDVGAQHIEDFYHQTLRTFYPSAGWRARRAAHLAVNVSRPAIRVTLQTMFRKSRRQPA